MLRPIRCHSYELRICVVFSFSKKTFIIPRRRPHGSDEWAHERGEGICIIARAFRRLLDEENCHGEWRDRRWQRSRPWRPAWRTQPRRFNGPPPRGPFRRMPDPGRWRPFQPGNWAWRREWWSGYQRARPWSARASPLPRRGPPVAAIKVPLRYQLEGWKSRQSRGSDPRGTQRGGPEMSAKEPQTPFQKPSQQDSGGERRRKTPKRLQDPRSSPSKIVGA